MRFNQLHPRFAPFVLSSVRERELHRQVVLRVINWRQRVEDGREEVIGEVKMDLAQLIPSVDSEVEGASEVELKLVNGVRQFIGMKTAEVGLVTLSYEALSGSHTLDTAPSSAIKSVRQINEEEKRAVHRKKKRELSNAGAAAAAAAAM